MTGGEARIEILVVDIGWPDDSRGKTRMSRGDFTGVQSYRNMYVHTYVCMYKCEWESSILSINILLSVNYGLGYMLLQP